MPGAGLENMHLIAGNEMDAEARLTQWDSEFMSLFGD